MGGGGGVGGEGRSRRPNVVVFVVWSALIVGKLVGVAWGRKSYLVPPKISSSSILEL